MGGKVVEELVGDTNWEEDYDPEEAFLDSLRDRCNETVMAKLRAGVPIFKTPPRDDWRPRGGPEEP